MKRLIVLLALLVLCVGTASAALNLNFQNSGDFTQFVECYGGAGCAWTQNTTGGNSYVSLVADGTSKLINADPLQTTYVSFTALSASNDVRIYFYDANKVTLGTLIISTVANSQVEIKITGTTALIYRNSKLVAEQTGITQNPSYIGFLASGGTLRFDNFIYGETGTHYTFGNPASNCELRKDLLLPASNGFYCGGSLMTSSNFTSTYAFGDGNSSRAIVLREWGSAYEVGRFNTTVGQQQGYQRWSVADVMFNNPSAPYGYYVTTYAESGSATTEVSNVLLYSAGGASCTWGADTYSTGSTASINTVVSGGGYWDTATYNYEVRVTDLYGSVKKTIPVTAATQTGTYTFASSDTQGIYFANLYAIRKADSAEFLMAGDMTELSAYVFINGWVNDGETQFKIPVARVNFYQGSTPDYITTAVDGNYTTTQNFLTGSQIIINVTATGYRPYQKNFTPIASVNNPLNFTLVPDTPVTTGIALGGVVREGDGQGATTSIPPKPIANATVRVWNATYGESWSVEGNRMGYWLLDQSKGATLTSNRLYEMSATRGGYSNFSIYRKVVTG